MIEKIKIYPRQEILKWILLGIQPFHKWSLISITGNLDSALTNREKLQLKLLSCTDILSLQFVDCSAIEAHDESYVEELEKINSSIFNENHCEQIISFITEANKKSEKEILIVHCMAGISRSGAIGTFANDILKLDYNRFKKDNPIVRPNPFILRTLRNHYNYWDITTRPTDH